MQVEALGRGIRGHENAYVGSGVVEGRLDILAVRLVHPFGAAGAEQRQHPLGGIPFPQTPRNVVERGLVFGEDDQAFVGAETVGLGKTRGAELRALTQQAFDQRGQRVESCVHRGCLLRYRRAVEIEAEGRQRRFHAPNFLLHIVREVLEPCADDGRCGRFALLCLPVVAGLLAQRPFRRAQLRFGRRLVGESLSGAPP